MELTACGNEHEASFVRGSSFIPSGPASELLFTEIGMGRLMGFDRVPHFGIPGALILR